MESYQSHDWSTVALRAAEKLDQDVLVGEDGYPHETPRTKCPVIYEFEPWFNVDCEQERQRVIVDRGSGALRSRGDWVNATQEPRDMRRDV